MGSVTGCWLLQRATVRLKKKRIRGCSTSFVKEIEDTPAHERSSKKDEERLKPFDIVGEPRSRADAYVGRTKLRNRVRTDNRGADGEEKMRNRKKSAMRSAVQSENRFRKNSPFFHSFLLLSSLLHHQPSSTSNPNRNFNHHNIPASLKKLFNMFSGPHSSSNKHAKIKAHKKSNYKPNGRNALAKCAYRYGFKNVKNGFICAPDGPKNKVIQMKKPGDMNDATEIPTTDIALDLEYTVPVTVGTPGVKMNLDLDTGSSDFWCWSTEARVSAASKHSHDLYDPKASKTSKHAKGQTWQISYGDGSSASGDVYQDTVQFGSVVVDKMNVECAKDLSDSFISDVASDGLMGMAWDSLNTVQPTQVPTMMSMMLPMLDKPLFTANLMMGSGGFYTIGNIDEGVTKEEIVYTPVDNSDGFWKVATPKWSLNGEEMQTSFGNAIMNTGTSLMLLDDATCAKFYESIQGATLNQAQGGYTFPKDADMPTVTFFIGDNLKITMAFETLAFGEPDADGNVFGAIQSAGNLGFAIFGDSFLKNCYAVFNQGDQTFGGAQKPCVADLV